MSHMPPAPNPAPNTSSYSDSFARGNQSGLGRADTGQLYTLAGAGVAHCKILGGRYVGENPPTGDATVYAGVLLDEQPITIGGMVSFLPGPGGAAPGAIALISSNDGSITLQHMVHLVLTPISCNVTWWNGATQNQQMAHGGWEVEFDTPLAVDGTSYPILMTINGDNVHVDLPDGTSHDWYDPMVSALAGTFMIFELQYNNTSTSVPRWDSTVAYDGSFYSVKGTLSAASGLVNTPVGTATQKAVVYADRMFPNKVLIGVDEHADSLAISDATTEQMRIISTGTPARIALQNNAGAANAPMVGVDTLGVGDVGLILQTGNPSTSRVKIHGDATGVEVTGKLAVADLVTITVASTEQARFKSTGTPARVAFETNAGANYKNFIGVDVLGGGDVGFIFQTGNPSESTRFAIHTDGTVEALFGIRFSNEIAPAQLTGNQDNYNPTGFSTAAVVILTSDASRDITGFAAPTDGRMVWVYNNGAQNIVLKHDVTSTAANRLWCRGAADQTLTPKTGVQLYYSPSIDRWVVMTDTL